MASVVLGDNETTRVVVLTDERPQPARPSPARPSPAKPRTSSRRFNPDAESATERTTRAPPLT